MADPDAAPPPARFPVDAARIEFTRPYFPYPDTARYTGKGDVKDYKNWVKATARSPEAKPAAKAATKPATRN